jgi:hypothetical protein
MGTGALTPNGVAVLRKYDSSELNALKEAFPSASEQALLNEHLGRVEPSVRLQIDVTLAALGSCLRRWLAVSEKLRAKAHRANQWTLTASLLAVIGSGSSLPLIFGGARITAAIAASIALIGALIGVVEQFMRRDIFGGANSLAARHQSLIANASRANAIQRILVRYQSGAKLTNDEAVELEKIITEADELIGRMDADLEALPISA